jgi:hypothetical protein
MLENRGRVEARVLAACRPGQVAERLHVIVTLHDVDPVTYFDAADQRQELVRGEVERVEHQAELLVADERKEPIRAVARPQEKAAVPIAEDLGLDER